MKKLFLVYTIVIVGSLVVSIVAFHVGGRGSIPHRGATNYSFTVYDNSKIISKRRYDKIFDALAPYLYDDRRYNRCACFFTIFTIFYDL